MHTEDYISEKTGLLLVVPHRRWEPGDYTHWKHATPRELAGAENQTTA